MKLISPTQFRQNIYAVLDQILQSGATIGIKRGKSIIKLSVVQSGSKLAKLKPKNITVGDPESLVSGDWKNLWQAKL